MKDPSKRQCSYSNLGKIIIKSWLLNMWLRRLWLRVADLTGKSRLPTSSEQSKKWPVRSSPSFSDRGCLHNRPVPLIPTCSILPLFNFVDAGISTTAIAAAIPCTPRAVRRIRSIYLRFGTTTVPTNRSGPGPKITPMMGNKVV